MRIESRRIPASMLLVFLAAVLVPSVALAVLALRAADRESVYVERRIESALFAEVNLAAQRVENLMDEIRLNLDRDLERVATAASDGGADQTAIASLLAWKRENPLVGTPFLLQGGVLRTPAEETRDDAFSPDFSAFLSGKERIPVYDSILRVYRTEEKVFGERTSSLPSIANKRRQTAEPLAESVPASSPPAKASMTAEGARPLDPGVPPPAAAPPSPPSGSAEKARYDDDLPPTENRLSGALVPPTVAPEREDASAALDTAASPPSAPAPAMETSAAAKQAMQPQPPAPPSPAFSTGNAAPVGDKAAASAPPEEKQTLSGLDPTASPPRKTNNIRRKEVESRIQADPVLREEAFSQATQGGFEILQRNVVPQVLEQQDVSAGAGSPSPIPADERSQTVARSRSFEELRAEEDGGFLPRDGERGLSILYWRTLPDGGVAGCSIRMDVLRDRIADTLPDLRTEVRLLTILDEAGVPLALPDGDFAQDWRRPFAAREISPLLPRWEAGAWLVDPELPGSRARFAQSVVWMLVSILFLTILLGCAAVLWMLSSEMRLAARKTTFVANVSHELKTPLTSIRLFAELLLSGRQRDEGKQREYLRTMMSEADRLAHLVDNVLAFSRRDRTKDRREPLLLDDLAAETVDQMEPHLARQGFAVRFRRTDPLPVVGDREALRQVLMNLLANAEKYSDETREIVVSCTRRDGRAAVEIADRGIGVAPQHAERIFEEFFRSDDSLSAPRSGAGLGLSIARGIARRHGGDIHYRPRKDGGSAFTLRLPAEE